jgi:hypothetical protein
LRRIRADAAEILGPLFLSDEERAWRRAGWFLELLGAGATAALPSLLLGLRDPDESRRRELSARVFGLFSTEPAFVVQRLVERLVDGASEVCIAAIRALSRFNR